MGAAEELADVASNVVPLRWTARGFVRAGVVFSVCGANVSVAGPPGRADLHDLLVAEVKRRTDAFVKFAPLDGRSPFPRVGLLGVRPGRAGACDACGDPLEPGRGGMCPLCTVALQKVLKTLGRLT